MAHKLVARERDSGLWALDWASFDRAGPGHSACEGACKDLGDARHAGSASLQAATRARAVVLAGSARASEAHTAISRTAVGILVRPSRLGIVTDYAAMDPDCRHNRLGVGKVLSSVEKWPSLMQMGVDPGTRHARTACEGTRHAH
jgi:hypothetical protein